MTAPQPTPGPSKSLNLDEMDWQALFKRHGQKIAIGASALVIAAAAVWLYISSEQRKETFAAQELEQARSEAEAGNLPLATSDLTRLIDRFGGTRAADQAVISLNQIRLIQGQRDVAINALQQFVRSRLPDYVAASAYGLLGGGLEDQGKLREAGAAYRQAAGRAELDFQKAGFLLDAGRTLAASGDSTGAKASYGEVLAKYGALDQAAEARVRMAELGGVVPAPADSVAPRSRT
jgi:TolA-binding protein